MGRKVLPVRLDISKRGEIETSVAEAIETFGRIDVLVNNVGVAPGDLAERVAEVDVDEILRVNIKGTFLVTQTVARQMIAQKAGRIISISSQAGTVTLRGEAIYCMSKAAINHLMRCLAAEWAQYGITVNTVAPLSYGPMERNLRCLTKTFTTRHSDIFPWAGSGKLMMLWVLLYFWHRRQLPSLLD